MDITADEYQNGMFELDGESPDCHISLALTGALGLG
jgi:hypothetical protein